jgi:uncharacterized protein (DUF305 family)
MRRATNRRRFLYLLGATSAVGFAGYGAADEHSDDHGHDQDHDEHERDHDDGHHEDEEAYEGEFNHADIEFMQMMIHHHEQAIEMAELIPGRTDRQELCELGPEIIEVQQAEIELMHDWLDEAGAEARDHELDHHDMEGMMSPEEMQHLREIDGQEFDCLFVEHMIHHHEGAIIMSEDVLEDGQADRVAELAEDVINVQETEIEMMEGWQRDWEC